jgi:hypothetical protein
MISTTGIIPEELMYWQKKPEVINWLLAQPLPGELKRRLLEGWGVTVGLRIRAREYQLLEDSGVDGNPARPAEGE